MKKLIKNNRILYVIGSLLLIVTILSMYNAYEIYKSGSYIRSGDNPYYWISLNALIGSIGRIILIPVGVLIVLYIFYKGKR